MEYSLDKKSQESLKIVLYVSLVTTIIGGVVAGIMFKGRIMKRANTFIIYTLSMFLLTACGESTTESHTQAVQNPVDTYLDSRIDAIELAKKSVKESNTRIEEENKMMESLTK